MKEKTTNIMTCLAKRASIVAVAIILATAAIAGTAYAYFTAYSQANGSHTLELGYSTTLNEPDPNEHGGNKEISMTNTGNTDVMVRIQLFYGTDVNNKITVETPGAEGWVQDGNTWNYVGTDDSKVLAPGESTTVLPVNVKAEEGVDLSSFDVIVIGQTSPVYYDDAGEPVPYLWSGDQQANES